MPICCVAMEGEKEGERTRGVGLDYIPTDSELSELEDTANDKCTITKKYHSSPQESREFAIASKIGNIGEAELKMIKSGEVSAPEEYVNHGLCLRG